jgi:hypothetical protein
VGFLKIAAADFLAGDERREGEDGHPAAVTVVEAVDQMQVRGATTAGTDRQSSGEMRLRACGKRGRLFMAYVHPAQVLVSANRVGDSVMPLRASPATP